MDRDGEIPLGKQAPSLMERYGWDVVVYLSDLTHRRGGKPVLFGGCDQTEAVIVFVPALGVWRQPARIVRVIQDLLAAGSAGWPPPVDDMYMPASGVSGPVAHLRMLTGMMHSNRPSGMLGALCETDFGPAHRPRNRRVTPSTTRRPRSPCGLQ